MVKTASTMLPLGVTAPDFSLVNVDGRTVSLRDFADAPVLVVAFICNHCPFVKLIANELAVFGRELQAQGGALVAINPNDAAHYPDDSPERMVREAEERGYTFPYLYDETQAVAKAYRAACTPDFFVFDQRRKLVYRGQFDDARPNSGIAVTGRDLKAAVASTLAAQPIAEPQLPSIGCNIKWIPGQEPDYFNPKGV